MEFALEALANLTPPVWLSAAVLLAIALSFGLVSPSPAAAAIAQLTSGQSWRHKPRSNALDITPSLLGRVRWLGGMADTIQRAYAATGRGAFQYTTLRGRRQLVLCSDKLIAELAEAPVDVLSFPAWVQEVSIPFCSSQSNNGGWREAAGGSGLTWRTVDAGNLPAAALRGRPRNGALVVVRHTCVGALL